MSYTRKRPSAVVNCPHRGCKWGRIKFYDEQPNGIDKAKAYFALFRMWLNHDKRWHKRDYERRPETERATETQESSTKTLRGDEGSRLFAEKG